MRDEWDTVNVSTHRDGNVMKVERKPVVELPSELAEHVTAKA